MRVLSLGAGTAWLLPLAAAMLAVVVGCEGSGAPAAAGDPPATGTDAAGTCDCAHLDGPCQAGTCDPETGACTAVPTAGACNDGDPCTENDACEDGTCAGTAVACPDTAPCDVGVCNPVTGACATVTLPDGAPCDDGDACTEADRCAALVCLGTARDCAALGGPCRVGTCSADTGACVALDVPDDAPCDDGDACTTDDRCGGGACTGGTPRAAGDPCDDGDACTDQDVCTDAGCTGSPADCSPLDGPCQTGACEAGTGACVAIAAAEGDPCDDGMACSAGDVCTAGTCRGDTTACPCVGAPDGTACDDGDVCTAGDACLDGQCAGAPADCNAFEGPCTHGVCTPGEGCEAVPKLTAAPCNDGDPCTTDDTCLGGLCLGTPVTCGGPSPSCGVRVCTAAAGGCTVAPLPDGVGCDDGDPCTAGELCTAGACVGGDNLCGPCLGQVVGAPCDASTPCAQPGTCRWVGPRLQCVAPPTDCAAWDGPCQVGACELETGACQSTPRADGAPCDDGDACTGPDACSGGQCVGPAAPCPACAGLAPGAACDDGDPCTQDDACSGATGALLCRGALRDCAAADAPCAVGVCDPVAGGCVAAALPDGAACDDADPCTAGDACSAGECTAGTNTCGTCQGQPLGAPCNDGDACTTGDVCVGLADHPACRGVPVDCSYEDGPCRVGACVPGVGCMVTWLPEGTPCDDGAPCTADDRCANAACQGAPGACAECAGLFPGDPCSDGSFCTTDDRCTLTPDGLMCVGTTKDCASLDGPCTVGVCHPASGGCTQALRPAQTPCDDGRPCTDATRCTDGVCAGGVALCGQCTDLPSGAPCDDGNACTVGDACMPDGGLLRCAGSPVDCAGPSGPCAVAICDAATGGCVAAPLPDGAACEDGAPCTAGDVCTAGVCAGPQSLCGSCAGKTAGAPCTDDDPCTAGDACVQSGDLLRCQGSPVVCAASSDPCQRAHCDPAAGGCTLSDRPDGTACDDGDGCLGDDRCEGGACVGNTPLCGPCQGKAPGAPCSDGRACTVDDACQPTGAGLACVGAPKPCATDTDTCTVGFCVEATGACETVPGPDGLACDDGAACTGCGRCQSGACMGVALPLCGATPALCEGLPAGEATPIALQGGSATVLGFAGGAGDYSLWLEQGQHLSAAVLPHCGGGVAATVALRAAPGQAPLVAASGASPTLEAFAAPATGTYWLTVRTEPEMAAPTYLLSVSVAPQAPCAADADCGCAFLACAQGLCAPTLPALAEPDDTPETGTPLEIGAQAVGYVGGPGDQDWLRVALSPDEPVTIETLAFCADTVVTALTLFGAEGGEALAHAQGQEGSPARLTGVVVPAPGLYAVRVTGANGPSGRYVVRVQSELCTATADCGCVDQICGAGSVCVPALAAIEGAEPTTLAVGERVTAWIDAPYETDTFTVALGVGTWQVATWDYCGAVTDTVLTVRAPDGSVVAEDDDSGPGTLSTIEALVVPKAGAYTVTVSPSGAATGPYVLVLQSAGARAGGTP